METEEEYAAFVFNILCIVILRRLRTRYRLHVWLGNWLHRKQQHSAHYTLLQELDSEDASPANYLRINKENFDILLKKIKPYNTNMRDAI